MRAMIGILSLLAILALVYGIGSIQCHLQDTQRATNNTFTAYYSTIWTQTTRADFELGLPTRVDTATVPGDVLLATTGNHYRPTGNLLSQVLDTGREDATIDLLYWDAVLPSSTSITFFIRASDTPFSATSSKPAWINVGTLSPIVTDLPEGQYIQWQVNLETSNNQRTPDLKEVQVWYH